MVALLNIAALAHRTGVAAGTLRKWEQRYGVLRPARTEGGQRRYTEADIARVTWLRARLGEGYRISEAASMLGPGAAAPAETPAELRDLLIRDVARGDPVAVAHCLDHAFALLPIETALTDVIEPTLAWVGEAWASGELPVAHERVLTQAIRNRLESQLVGQGRGTRGTAVLACAPAEDHELGLLMAAVLLRADGWQVVYLGRSIPIAESVGLAQRLAARLLGVSATLPARLADLKSGFNRVAPADGLAVVLGGKAVTEETAAELGAQHAGGELGRAVLRLRKLAV